jgi:hypothetical protein
MPQRSSEPSELTVGSQDRFSHLPTSDGMCMYSSSRLVTLCLSPLEFPTGDEFEWGEVGQGLMGTDAVVGVLPAAELMIEPRGLIGVGVHLVGTLRDACGGSVRHGR